jgi:hypothetical protein
VGILGTSSHVASYLKFLGDKSNVWSACRKGVQSFIDSNNVSPNHSKEVFLNLHPQASISKLIQMTLFLVQRMRDLVEVLWRA